MRESNQEVWITLGDGMTQIIPFYRDEDGYLNDTSAITFQGEKCVTICRNEHNQLVAHIGDIEIVCRSIRVIG